MPIPEMTLREYTDAKKALVRKMLEQGLSTTRIAEEFGVWRQSMWQFIRRYDLDAGLNRATKPTEDYYVNQRVKPALADQVDVKILRELSAKYDRPEATNDNGKETV